MNTKEFSNQETINGYFYMPSKHKGSSFIIDKVDLDHYVWKLTLSEKIADTVLKEDFTFGMLVGGDFLYYAKPVELIKPVIKSIDNIFFVESAEKIVLMEENQKQMFTLT